MRLSRQYLRRGKDIVSVHVDLLQGVLYGCVPKLVLFARGHSARFIRYQMRAFEVGEPVLKQVR